MLFAFITTLKAQVLTESFENATFPPTNWTQEHVTNTTNWQQVTTNGNGSITAKKGSKMAEFRKNKKNHKTKLITPKLDINALTNPELVFYMANVEWAGDIDALKVFYKASAAGSWVEIGAYTAANTSWKEIRLDLPNKSNNYYIAFEGESNYGRGLNIDDIVINEKPTCLPVSNIVVTPVSGTDVSINWTTNSSETNWEYVVQTAGTGQPTGAGTTTSSKPLTINTLNPATNYEVYIRAKCSNSDFGNWIIKTFKTPCGTVNAPFYENFENGGTIPDCWTKEGYNDWKFSNTVGSSHVGERSIEGETESKKYFAWADDSGNDPEATLQTPYINTSTIKNPVLSFYELSDNRSVDNNTRLNKNASLKVDVFDGTKWNTLKTYNTNTNEWQLRIIPLQNLTITGPISVRFKFKSAGTAYYTDDIAIDDVRISEGVIWSGATNKDWNTSSNWLNNTGVPNTNSIVIINNTSNIAKIANGNTVNIKGILIEENSALTVEGTLNSTRYITVNNGGSLLTKNTGVINATVTYNRNITDKWHLVAAPVKGENIKDLVRDGIPLAEGSAGKDHYGFGRYNNVTPKWEYYKLASTENIPSGKGYAIKRKTSGNIFFTGTFNNDNVNTTTVDGSNNWNLIGNPYTAYLAVNASAGAKNLLSTNISKLATTHASFYYWDAATSTYKPVNNATATRYFAPTQGFFVKTKSGTNNIQITKDMLSHQTTDVFSRTKPNSQIDITVTNGSETKSTSLIYLENASKGLDIGYDAGEFNLTKSSELNLTSQLVTNNNGVNFVLQALPKNNLENLIVPLNLKAKAGKELTFSVNEKQLPNNAKIYLEDKETNTYNEINNSKVYKVTLSKNTNGIGRFFIHTSSKSFNNSNEIKSINVYIKNYTLFLANLPKGNTSLRMYDLLGKQVYSKQFTPKETQSILPNQLSSGVYIIRIASINGIFSEKILVK